MKIIEEKNRYELLPEDGMWIMSIFTRDCTNHAWIVTKKYGDNPSNYIEITDEQAQKIIAAREEEAREAEVLLERSKFE